VKDELTLDNKMVVINECYK